MKMRLVLGALALVAVGACATSGAGAGAADTEAEAQRSSPYIITEAEIRAGNFQSVYEAIEQLRPQFFRGRSARSMGGTSIPTIYVGSNRTPDAQTLHSLSPNGVREIRYLTDLQANQRFGPGHDNGAIVVTLR
jgi:hypothetical protein